MRFLILSLLVSCAVPQRRQVILDVHAQSVDTRSGRILACVDKYRGEGLQNAYEVCKDVHLLK